MSAPATPGRLAHPLVFWAAACFAAFCAWAYAWTPPGENARWLTPQPIDYYHEYAEALLAGQLHLARAPDPRLVALTDPYDPAANAPYRLNDLSYYQGRYHLYHSIVPALVVFAPVKLLTGQHLSQAAAVWVFCLVGFTASLALLLGWCARHAPRCPPLVVAAGALALAFAQGAHVVLHTGMLNGVPIASAYAFGMLGLLALARTFSPGRHPLRWLAAASLLLGLAVASRPNYVFAGAVALLLGMLAHWRRDGVRPGPLLAAGLPLAAVIAALLACNHVRYGQPLEFGARYMLGGWDQRTLPALGLDNFVENARHYLFAPAHYTLHFPFVTAPTWTAVGILLHVPFLWLALLPALPRNRSGGPVSWMFGALLAFGLVNLGLLLFLPSGNSAAVLTSANARYLLDFQPALVLLAALAAASAGHALAERAWPRRILVATGLLLAGASALAGLSLDLSRFPLESYRSLARLLSQPAWRLEEWKGVAYGPVALEVVFPENRPGSYEPLVSTGTAQAGDLVYAHYDSPQAVRFGLVGVGTPGPLSEPIPVDYRRPHRLELHLGSLNPRVSHPLMAGFDEAQLALLQRRLVVRLDDRVVFTAPASFHPAAPGQVAIGRTEFLRDYAAENFSGQILRHARLPVGPAPGVPAEPAGYGALRLKVRFPAGRGDGAEPLLATGIPQAGDVFFVGYRSDGAIRLGLDHWGHRSTVSDWIPLDRSAEHTVELSSGALFPSATHPMLADLPADRRQALKERVRITLDGRPVLDLVQPTYESSPYDVVVGHNPIGASSCSYRFTGEVLAAERPR